MLAVGDVPGDQRPGALVRPEVLGLAARVAGDHRVGRGQDVLGGAVVLFQHDDPGVGEVLLELNDVADGGAAEGVDRLVRVTDHAQLGLVLLVRPDQLTDQDVLGVVGVLVLVHQDVPEPAPVLGRDLGEGLEQEHRVHDEVIEVHRAGVVQPPLVLRVGLGQRLLPVRLGLGRERLVVDQLVLQVGHLGGQRLGRVLPRVELQLAADQGHQPLRVGLVVDGERGRVTEPLGLPAQDAHAGGVERHDPHRPGLGPDQLGHPGGHLTGGLVGKGDGQDLARQHVPLGEQVGDPVGQHPGLARAGAGHDQQRAAGVDDGRPLLRIEPVQKSFSSRSGHLSRLGAAPDIRPPEPAAERRRRFAGGAATTAPSRPDTLGAFYP